LLDLPVGMTNIRWIFCCKISSKKSCVAHNNWLHLTG